MRAGRNLNGTNRRKFRGRPLVELAVDDTPLRAAYAYAPTANGFEVRVIDDPAAAPAGTPPKYPDVLVVDVSADSGYGWTFVQGFKSHDRAVDIPAIAIVANADERTRAHARRQRCAAVCARTCPPSLLSSGIRAVLDFAAVVAAINPGRFRAYGPACVDLSASLHSPYHPSGVARAGARPSG